MVVVSVFAKLHRKQLVKKNEISQEFIVGTDITIPILFNPLNSKLELLPAIAYMHHKGEDWYLGEKKENFT